MGQLAAKNQEPHFVACGWISMHWWVQQGWSCSLVDAKGSQAKSQTKKAFPFSLFYLVWVGRVLSFSMTRWHLLVQIIEISFVARAHTHTHNSDRFSMWVQHSRSPTVRKKTMCVLFIHMFTQEELAMSWLVFTERRHSIVPKPIVWVTVCTATRTSEYCLWCQMIKFFTRARCAT